MIGESSLPIGDPDALMAYANVELFEPRPPSFHKKPKQPVGIRASELQALQFPPIKYVIPGYIVEGLTIFAGRPKLGKSWCCLDWGGAVASGGVAFGSIQCEEGDVLYLALEDNQRRLKSRLEKVLPVGEWPNRLTFWTECKRLDRGGLDAIRNWIIEAKQPRLVMIDVIAGVRPDKRGNETLYGADYRAIEGLHGLARDHGLAIVVVTHVRKMDADDPLDTVSGTLGFTGAADSVLVLNRDSQGVTLYGRGRDIEEIETAVQFDRDLCRWSILGQADDVRRSDERQQIIEALGDSPKPTGPAEIAKGTGMKAGNIRKLLTKMATAGEIKKVGYGKYSLNTPDHTDHTGHTYE